MIGRFGDYPTGRCSLSHAWPLREQPGKLARLQRLRRHRTPPSRATLPFHHSTTPGLPDFTSPPRKRLLSGMYTQYYSSPNPWNLCHPFRILLPPAYGMLWLGKSGGSSVRILLQRHIASAPELSRHPGPEPPCLLWGKLPTSSATVLSFYVANHLLAATRRYLRLSPSPTLGLANLLRGKSYRRVSQTWRGAVQGARGSGRDEADVTLIGCEITSIVSPPGKPVYPRYAVFGAYGAGDQLSFFL